MNSNYAKAIDLIDQLETMDLLTPVYASTLCGMMSGHMSDVQIASKLIELRRIYDEAGGRKAYDACLLEMYA